MQRLECPTLDLARAAGPGVCGMRLAPVGERHALMLVRFNREWNLDANAYWRFGLVSCLSESEDGYPGRQRWSYPPLADELRRWSVKSIDDLRGLFRRMMFSAMFTSSDDHPRNHALLRRRWAFSRPNSDLSRSDCHAAIMGHPFQGALR